MLFPTVAFATFFCVAFLANWLLRPHHRLWRLVMTLLSLFFYGWWDYRFVALLALAIVLNHLSAQAVHRWTPGRGPSIAGQAALVAGITANLAILAVFKYYGFFVTSATNMVNRTGLNLAPPLLEVTLPIGISFYTFQAISYIIDVHRGTLRRPMVFLDFAFYLSFFPQLVAGPIVRATEMVDQIRRRPDPRSIPASEALWLITLGLFKKVVISSYLAKQLVDPVLGLPSQHSGLEVTAAVYAYSIQIYADFSGYTDMAIGCALLLGFRFPQNFNAPYRAQSVSDFWRRWHMSLSRWLRDYLYLPLGGNRGGKWLTYRNLLLTMLLGGLWHGAAFTFIVWGLAHGLMMSLERAMGEWWKSLGVMPWAIATFRWLITFNFVTMAWVLFRAESLAHALEIYQVMFSFAAAPASVPFVQQLTVVAVVLTLAAVGSHFVPPTATRWWRWEISRLNPAMLAVLLAVTLTAADALGPQGVAPFIYFQF